MLTLEDCRKITAAAEAEAKKNNWNVCIAILDDGGHLLHLARMDGATPANARIAVEKGRTAAESRRSTAVWQERIKPRPEMLQHAGHHADPGRPADRGRGHLRRRGRHLRRAVARGRADRRRGHQGRHRVDSIKVLIAGAGIGGLTAALALCCARAIDVEVYEQAPELKEVGAGLQLSANGTRVFYELGVGDELKALSCEATGKEIRLWNTGETWKLFDLGKVSVERYGYPYFTVYRPDLLGVLAAAVRREKPDAIRLGSKCTGFSQDSTEA